MTLEEVIKYYGSWSAACRKMGMGSSSHQAWRNSGYIPIQTQIAMEIMSGGDLQAKVEDCTAQFEKYHKQREVILMMED